MALILRSKISLEGICGWLFGFGSMVDVRDLLELFQVRLESASTAKAMNPSSSLILRKEVIQPQVPLRLPCYDFTPVAKPTVVACFPCGLAQRLRVDPTPMV